MNERVRRLWLSALVLSLALGLSGCGMESLAVGEKEKGASDDFVTTESVEAEAVAEEVSLTVGSEEITRQTIRTASFSDVSEDSEDYDTVCYMAYHGILQGVGEGRFDRYSAVNRAMVVTVLYRMSGESAPEGGTVFEDVPKESWYADAVAWASTAGITTGTSESCFSPLESVTREQLAALLRRYVAYCGGNTECVGDLSAYSDRTDVQSYAVEPLVWALENGLYRTMVDDTIHPDLLVSRLQLAQALLGVKKLEGDELAGELLSALPEKSSQGKSNAKHEALQEIVDTVAKKYGAVGLQVAVVENGEVTDTYAYGWATKGTDPMTADHKMRIASISKLAVGVTAMLLKEEGTVSLDEDIGTYWGVKVRNSYWPNEPITLRNMLMHTSSIVNVGDDVSRVYSSVKALLQKKSGFSSTKPGSISSWSYNNYAYGVLGMTLELAGEEYISEVLDRRLFDRMGIDAAYVAKELDNSDLLTTLYYHGGSVARTTATQKTYQMWTSPGAKGIFFAGGLLISARDLGKAGGPSGYGRTL